MQNKIRVMTYNVHSCIGMDGKASTERIAEVIFRSNVDIVSLQEVDIGLRRTGFIDQAQEVAGVLEMNSHFHPSVHMKEGIYGNAILSRFPLQLIRGEALPAPRALRRFEKRGAMLVETGGSVRIRIINTHFGLVRRERLMQVQEILNPKWIGNAEVITRLIICGDFNASPRSLVYHRIIDRFRDVQRFQPGWRPRKTWPTRYPLTRIDHIFVSPDLSVEEVEVPQDSLTRVASDHLPLVATLICDEHTQSGAEQ